MLEENIGRTAEDGKAALLHLYSMMPADRFNEHLKHERDLSVKYGRENEREEIICRLLASGMPVEEIAVVLCLRLADVQTVERIYTTKIMDYTKKLKERRKRREKK